MMNLKTQIVFISGFQDFVYAREAVKWGAADYLLKPIIREELTTALETCCRKLGRPEIAGRAGPAELEESEYEKLVQTEEGGFQPVLAQVIYPEETETRTRKLTDFSVVSCLDNALSGREQGIAFVKQETIALILKGVDPAESRSLLNALQTQVQHVTGQEVRFLLGQPVQKMSEVSAAYQRCLAEKPRLFFADRFPDCIMEVGGTPEKLDAAAGQRVREELIRTDLSRDSERFDRVFSDYAEAVYALSGEKKEDACFYFCTVLRQIQTRLSQMGLSQTGLEMADLLELGRSTNSWQTMLDDYRSILENWMQSIRKQAERSERATFLKAKAYIEEHYAEELTLAVLADHVHVNSYYFSAFFKKMPGKTSNPMSTGCGCAMPSRCWSPPTKRFWISPWRWVLPIQGPFLRHFRRCITKRPTPTATVSEPNKRTDFARLSQGACIFCGRNILKKCIRFLKNAFRAGNPACYTEIEQWRRPTTPA